MRHALDCIRQARVALDEAEARLLALLPPEPEILHVRRGDNLLSVLEQAPEGASVQLDPDVEWLGDVRIAKPVHLWSALLSGRAPASFEAGRIVGRVDVRAPGVVLEGLQIHGRIRDSALLTTGPGTQVRRCALLGHATGQHRGILANSADVVIDGCHIAGIWYDQDSQAILGFEGTRHLTVRDCYLEAAGENIMFGGADATSPERSPADILIENCHLAKDPAWRGRAYCVVKNLFELKDARRVTLRGCVLDRCWAGQGQDGYGLVLTVRNQDGRAPWATIEDVLIEDVVVRDVGAGVNILATDNNYSSGRMARVTLRRVRFERMNLDYRGAGRQVQILSGPEALTVEDCATEGAGWINSAVLFGGVAASGLRLARNRFYEGEYGLIGDGTAPGTPTLDRYAPGYTWEAMTILRKGAPTRWIPYPAGTTFETVAA